MNSTIRIARDGVAVLACLISLRWSGKMSQSVRYVPRVVALLSFLIGFYVGPANGFQEPVGSWAPAPDINARAAVNQTGAAGSSSRAPQSAAQSKKLDQIRQTVPGLTVRWSAFTGAPNRIYSTQSALTGPSNLPPEARARAYLTAQSVLFNLAPQDIAALVLSRNVKSNHVGTSHLTFQQQIDGIDIFGGTIKVNINAQGRIRSLSGQPIPNPSNAVNSDTSIVSADAALQHAAASAGVTNVESEQNKGLVYFPVAANDLRLAWNLVVNDRDSPNSYWTLVDATDGTVLWRKNLTSYAHLITQGKVYTSDSPDPGSPSGTASGETPGNNANPEGPMPREIVDFDGEEFFPHDDPHANWWNGSGEPDFTRTFGNNVRAREDQNGDDDDSMGITTTPTDGDFTVSPKFDINVNNAPSTYTDATVVNLFYWLNYLHDYWYRFGFDEGAGNAQTDNFGLGGMDSDPIQADAQDNSAPPDPNDATFCNAFMSAGDDGTEPQTRYLLCDRSSGAFALVDSALDNTIIAHEFGHLIVGRLTENSVSISQGRGMNEGFADYFGVSIFSEPDDDVDDQYSLGGWYIGNPDGRLRREYYSTDPTVFTRRYEDIVDGAFCAVKVCSNDDTMMCGADSDCGMGNTCDTTSCSFQFQCDMPPLSIDQRPCRSEEHDTGEIWANTLWIAHANLVKKFGFEVARNTLHQLIVDGLKAAPANPDFLDMRDEILIADLDFQAGATQCLLWDAFARMGMGVSALSGGAEDINVIQAFDTPPECTPNIDATVTADLGDVCLNDDTIISLRIFNNGTGDLIVNKIEFQGGNADEFTLDPTAELPVVIPEGAHVDFTMHHTATTSTGAKSTNIEIFSSDADDPVLTIPIEGLVGEAAISTFIANNGSYSGVCSGDIFDLNLTVQNNGVCPLEIDSISIENLVNAVAGDFVLPAGDVAGSIIEPGNSLLVPVRFSPSNFDSDPPLNRTADVRIESSTQFASSSLTTDDTAIDGVVPPPDINMAIADMGDFGEVCKGMHADLNLTLFNQGMCDLEISNIELLPAAPTSFELPSDLDLPLILSHDADFILPVRYAPKDCSDIPEMGQIKVTSDDPDEMMEFVDISGVAPCPNLVIDPADLVGLYAFPATVVDVESTLGCFTDRPVTLRNNANCPLTIDSILAAGADYSVIAPTVFPVILPTGEETLEATLRFTPQSDADPLAPSEVTGLMTVVSDDPDFPHTADLCGESVAQSGMRILVTDVSSGTPIPVPEVDSITIQSKGKNRPGPVNLQFVDQPLSSTSVCLNDIFYHVDQETLPSTETTGSGPQSSYQAKAREGNLQATESFSLAQCEFRDFQIELQDSDSGICLLAPKGASCTTDGECCSGKCKGSSGAKTCK